MKITHEICERSRHFGIQSIFQIIKVLREVLKPQMLSLTSVFICTNKWTSNPFTPHDHICWGRKCIVHLFDRFLL